MSYVCTDSKRVSVQFNDKKKLMKTLNGTASIYWDIKGKTSIKRSIYDRCVHTKWSKSPEWHSLHPHAMIEGNSRGKLVEIREKSTSFLRASRDGVKEKCVGGTPLFIAV